MNKACLVQALSSLVGQALAEELTTDYLKLRQDCLTATLERSSPGKFVETFVQCLQQIASGTYKPKPNVDEYLSRIAENELSLPEDLRICATRVARSIYTLRNKRNIAHKNPVDTNSFDLTLAHHSAAWIMAELLRNSSGLSMQEAGRLIELLQAPVGTLVEEIDGTRLVYAKTSIKGEILILLHSSYPKYITVPNIVKSMSSRNPDSVKNCLRKLSTEKLLYGNGKAYKLTKLGHTAALVEINLHK